MKSAESQVQIIWYDKHVKNTENTGYQNTIRTKILNDKGTLEVHEDLKEINERGERWNLESMSTKSPSLKKFVVISSGSDKENFLNNENKLYTKSKL